MSFQPLSLDTSTQLRGEESSAPECRIQNPPLAGTETSAPIPGQRAGRRGGATTCLHLSPASIPAPSIWSKGMFCSTFPTSIIIPVRLTPGLSTPEQLPAGAEQPSLPSQGRSMVWVLPLPGFWSGMCQLCPWQGGGREGQTSQGM